MQFASDLGLEMETGVDVVRDILQGLLPQSHISGALTRCVR